ncbi:MAG TPA: succinate dehydrogenase cytochrome b subunit [Abditibacteriaceae bacterium]
MSKLTRATNSAVGRKAISALSGLLLTVFLIGHLLGNLTIFKGRGELMNAYAAFLHGIPGLPLATIAIVALFALHAYMGFRVWKQNKDARPQEYKLKQWTGSARSRKSVGSTTMMVSGFVVLAFIIVHIWHFKYGMAGAPGLVDKQAMAALTAPRSDAPAGEAAEALTGGDTVRGGVEATNATGEDDEKNLAGLVLSEFKKPLVSVMYIGAMILLGLHLNHGFSSAFQSIGASRLSSGLRLGGQIFTFAIVAGFISIPLWVLFFRK